MGERGGKGNSGISRKGKKKKNGKDRSLGKETVLYWDNRPESVSGRKKESKNILGLHAGGGNMLLKGSESTITGRTSCLPPPKREHAPGTIGGDVPKQPLSSSGGE